MEVHFGGFWITVSKQCLYISLFYALFHEVGGKTVPEAVRSSLICILCGPFSTAAKPHPLLTPWRESLKNTLPELAELLLSDLLERFYNRYPEYTPDSRIEKSLNYIAGNIARHITLSDAAAAANLSPSRFSHLFKSCCGIVSDLFGFVMHFRSATV